MPNRAKDWLLQAEHDLKHAGHAREVGDHDWACFAAQQAAEKAVKALHQAHGQEAWGHSVLRLLTDAPVAPPEALIEQARTLDTFYVPARYPKRALQRAGIRVLRPAAERAGAPPCR